MTAALDQTRSVVRAEVAAGLLPEVTARSLNWTLGSISEILASTTFREIEIITRTPVENVKVAEALKALEVAWKAADTSRRRLLDVCLAESLRNVRAALQPQDNSVDLEVLKTHLENLQQANAQITPVSSNYDRSGEIGARRNFVVELQRFRAGETQKNLPQMGRALANLRLCQQGMLNAEIDRFADAYVEPYREAFLNAKSKLKEAVSTDEDLKALQARLAACAAAADALGQIQTGTEAASKSDRVLLNYRNCLEGLQKMQEGQIRRGRELFNIGKNGLPGATPADVGALENRFSQIEKQLDEKSEVEAAARDAKWRKTLTEIQTPEQLDRFISELVTIRTGDEIASDAREGVNARRSLAMQLNPVLLNWKAASPLFQPSQSPGYIENLSPFAPELDALRSRAERDMLVRTLKAPELGQPPFANLDTHQAVEAFSHNLSKKKEWRRLLDLLEVHGLSFRNDIRTGLVKALRSYLSAENFERAELWPEAVSAYKEVLLCPDLRAPIDDAATRLKALQTSQPKAFDSTPATSKK